jgi:hypothetical protein
MHNNHEGPALLQMLNEALELACHENRVTEEHNIKILIATMLIIKVQFQSCEYDCCIINEYCFGHPYYCYYYHFFKHILIFSFTFCCILG